MYEAMLCYSMHHSLFTLYFSQYTLCMYIVYSVFCYYLWQWHNDTSFSQLSTLNFMHMYVLFYLPLSLLRSIENSNHSSNQRYDQCPNKLSYTYLCYYLDMLDLFKCVYLSAVFIHNIYICLLFFTNNSKYRRIVFLLVMNVERLSVLIFWMNGLRRWIHSIWMYGDS